MWHAKETRQDVANPLADADVLPHSCHCPKRERLVDVGTEAAVWSDCLISDERYKIYLFVRVYGPVTVSLFVVPFGEDWLTVLLRPVSEDLLDHMRRLNERVESMQALEHCSARVEIVARREDTADVWVELRPPVGPEAWRCGCPGLPVLQSGPQPLQEIGAVAHPLVSVQHLLWHLRWDGMWPGLLGALRRQAPHLVQQLFRRGVVRHFQTACCRQGLLRNALVHRRHGSALVGVPWWAGWLILEIGVHMGRPDHAFHRVADYGGYGCPGGVRALGFRGCCCWALPMVRAAVGRAPVANSGRAPLSTRPAASSVRTWAPMG